MALQDGWFSERNEQWAGVAISFKVDETLWDQKSEYQHVQVFKTAALGNVLVLDGVVQVSEKDEMAYQEMITHIPMFAHPNPEYVLIVGGGDGGVIREALKHPSVKEVTICEIDQMVIDVSKKFLPSVAVAWDDPKVKLHRGDAAEYIKRPECKGKFDVIVSDTSDPVGPAEALFKGSFYEAMSQALRPGGKVATQAESIWLHLPLIANLVKEASPYFANVEYAVTQIPTYPLGQIGFLLCSAAEAEKSGRGKSRKRAATPSCRAQVRSTADAKGAEFRYYSDELHSAAFVLPAFAAKAIFGSSEPAAASSSADPSAAGSAVDAPAAPADDGKKGKRAKKK